MVDFLPIISGAIGGAASSGAFAGPIQTLQDWWYVHFGYNLSNQKAMLLAKQEMEIEKLKDNMLQQVSTIPPENIQEPSIKILGPAIEASRYYIEEDELRGMFANIIAASLDNRKNKVIHSSFVEIIKQLDVLDAQLLSYFKRNHYGVQTYIPTMRMVVKNQNGSNVVLPLIFLNETFGELQQNAASLINLERLGIITLKSDTFLTDESRYDYIRQHETIIHLMTHHPEMELEESSFTITDFGENFINVCAV